MGSSRAACAVGILSLASMSESTGLERCIFSTYLHRHTPRWLALYRIYLDYHKIFVPAACQVSAVVDPTGLGLSIIIMCGHQTHGVLEHLQKMLRLRPLSLLWRGAMNQLAIVLINPRIQSFPILISRHPARSATPFSLIESHPQVLPFRMRYLLKIASVLGSRQNASSCGHASFFIGLLCKRVRRVLFSSSVVGSTKAVLNAYCRKSKGEGWGEFSLESARL